MMQILARKRKYSWDRLTKCISQRRIPSTYLVRSGEGLEHLTVSIIYWNFWTWCRQYRGQVSPISEIDAATNLGFRHDFTIRMMLPGHVLEIDPY